MVTTMTSWSRIRLVLEVSTEGSDEGYSHRGRRGLRLSIVSVTTGLDS